MANKLGQKQKLHNAEIILSIYRSNLKLPGGGVIYCHLSIVDSLNKLHFKKRNRRFNVWKMKLIHIYPRKSGHSLDKYLQILKKYSSIKMKEMIKSRSTIKRKDYSLQCDTCDKTLSSRKCLKTHISCVHEKIRQNECDWCYKVFTSNGNLKQHIRGVHEKIKLSTCHLCEKKFSVCILQIRP